MPATSDRCENKKMLGRLPVKWFVIVMVQVDYDPPHLPGPSDGNNQAKDP